MIRGPVALETGASEPSIRIYASEMATEGKTTFFLLTCCHAEEQKKYQREVKAETATRNTEKLHTEDKNAFCSSGGRLSNAGD